MKYAPFAYLIIIMGTPAAAQDATLRITADQSVYTAAMLERSDGKGYTVHIDCVSRCRHPVHYVKNNIYNSPLGLFSPDDLNGLIYLYSGAGAVGYGLRVWQVSDSGVKFMGEFAGRCWFEFRFDDKSHPVIHTCDADDGSSPQRSLTWTFENGVFRLTNN